MATAIKIYSTDSNENAIAKTVSNANPAASNYVLKNFGMQLMTLSNNAFRRAERIDTTDITNATDTGIAINTTSPFVSTDPATFKAAVLDLENSGTISFDLTQSAEDGATVTIAELKNWVNQNANFNAQSFANVVNQRLFDPKTATKNAEFVLVPNTGFKVIITSTNGSRVRVSITGNDTGAYEFIESLYNGADADTQGNFSGSAGSRKFTTTITLH